MHRNGLILALASVMCVVLSTPSMALEKVSFRLNWYLGGIHVPFYFGKEKGFYADEGIDLTINEGRGSANTVQVVAAGSDTFGLADSSSLITLVTKGGAIKSVMSLVNSTGFTVISLASTGIRAPKDLEGKRLAVSAGDPLAQVFKAVAAYNHLDMSKITFVQVDPAAKVVAVLEKRVDALLGGIDDQYFTIKYKGQEPAALRYSEHGANIVGSTIVTTLDTIAEKPDLVRGFVKATTRSWQAAMKDPDAAIDAAAKAKADVNRQSLRDQMEMGFELLKSPNSKDRLGFGAEKDWVETLAILKQYRGLETNEPWTTFHTNAFLPK